MYNKQAFSIEQQIQQLKERGLTIQDSDNAPHYLSHISYYRLAGYWWPMQDDKVNHIFKPNSKFCDVIALYNFDRELRLLLFDIIEKIEISLRTKLIYHLSHEFDPWWFQNFNIFQNAPDLVKTLSTIEEEIDRSKDTFIKEHKKKHKDDGRFPPSWKSLEQTSFGALSKLYGNLKNNISSKDIIAKEFGTVNHTYLPSWLQSIAQIRNYCAHHSRLWNRNLPGSPKLLPSPPNRWIQDVPKPHEFQFLYVHLCCMKYLLNVVQPENNFGERLENLLNKFPNVDPNALGMKKKWRNEDLWQ
ncbi:Abortive infection bacteriophage resistance protein [Sphingobacterium nematocida]|uniref:Abortive infection bacteriophage resistance protein n=1 Tax=Sphingobacterium nematocida TaxID=1513896 RepID=A0A1T5G308_9SPHI|nr:Abi family protein [Sphingobacterium nematocida]SKC02811.1 Abortive infection bacteriophage resistance protein [Sphingobacterium nematocida]